MSQTVGSLSFVNDPGVAIEVDFVSTSLKVAKSDAPLMTREQARLMVSTYYEVQERRKAAASQLRTLQEDDKPLLFVQWMLGEFGSLENGIKSLLAEYAKNEPSGICRWAMMNVGIGPVLSAGLMAHIDINIATSVGKIWRFAGLDPSSEWRKGERRPWNADLKVLCWKIGESFVKFKNHPDAFYGKIYDQRRAYEDAKNEAGEYAAQAEAKLRRFKIGKDTIARTWYEQGKLPPAHMNARAKRYAVKLFLSHWYEMANRLILGKEPPQPYAIVHLGHVDHIPAPFSDWCPE